MHRAASQQTPVSARLNLTPMIDMVFILLIFFVVTSSFVKESGVDVSRPTAQTASRQDQASIIVAIPLALLHTFVSGQSNRVLQSLDERSAELLARRVEEAERSRGGSGGGG
jgi:biopolymer transport protein ExbD